MRYTTLDCLPRGNVFLTLVNIEQRVDLVKDYSETTVVNHGTLRELLVKDIGAPDGGDQRRG